MLAHRRLGKNGPMVSAIGLGCMSLSGVYGKSDDEAGIGLIHHALDRGVDLLDSADLYGWGHNEGLVGRALKGRRQGVTLVSKFGQVKTPTGQAVDGRPEYVQQACEASLKRLGLEVIDLYFQHRIDPKVPTEDTVGAMVRLVEQGKVRYLGLSEARPETIRRAHKVHPITAVQTEFSLLYRQEAEETLQTTRELGIGFTAYSPLGRSLLTGAVQSAEDVKNDRRNDHPRFVGDNLTRNLALVGKLAAMAREKGCTPGQLALAWLLAQGDDIVPIPGTKRKERVDENLGALEVKLTPAEVQRIAAMVPPGSASGTRYPEGAMKAVYR